MRRASALFAAFVVTATACSNDDVLAPPSVSNHASAGAGERTSLGTTLSTAMAQLGRFVETALGQQPAVTPMLRIESPTSSGRVRRGEPVTIRVRYRDFDFRPELRTPNAGATLGSQPQTVVDGVVQGHIHGYLQRLPENGALPDADAVSFCVLERTVERRGHSGVAEGECPGVEPGEYRLSAEFQTNSHTAILKTGPRATITADVVTIRVR